MRTKPDQEGYISNDRGGKAMLVLTRRTGEEIVIGEQIRIIVAAVQGNHVRLGICAPPTVRVDRQEVNERRSLLSAKRLDDGEKGGTLTSARGADQAKVAGHR
jgi:carbon storage regulator